jgi:hypothetical protein
MLTNKEKFSQLMKEFEVPLIETSREATESLTIEDKGTTPKIEGYTCFFSEFVFDARTGAFIKVCIFE